MINTSDSFLTLFLC